MHSPEMPVWTGRDDTACEGAAARRWHQVVQPWQPHAFQQGHVLLGFECDIGVKRNLGRIGSAAGPNALRRALANLAWHRSSDLFDAGNILAHDDAMETAQEQLRQRASGILEEFAPLIILGGGHETAWGSFQALRTVHTSSRLGIINLDAHFDLRSSQQPHSGTPFAQMATWSQQAGFPFNYLCLGISVAANTAALFENARRYGATWIIDEALQDSMEPHRNALDQFLGNVDHVYLSIDLDVLPPSVMYAVSAPAGLGVPQPVLMQLIEYIARSGKLLLTDVVEYNPLLDQQQTCVRAAARLIWHLLQHWPLSR